MQELGQAVLEVLQQRRLDRRALNASDSLSLSNESERQLVKALLARYRGLPEEQQCWMSHRDTVYAPPEGFTAIGEVVAGAGMDVRVDGRLVEVPQAGWKHL